MPRSLAERDSNHDPANGEDEVAADLHAVQLSVWDVPSATVAGERFSFSVGVRCPAGCDLGGRELGLFDKEGTRITTARLGREICPGTEALYVAGVEARAPLRAESRQYEVKMIGSDADLPHTAGALPLIVRVVSPPDCEVMVKAIDREQQTPIPGARVVMHPYRAVTDDNGIARLSVARGQYNILVSVSHYLPVATSVEVAADITTDAELDRDQAWASPEEVYE